MAHFFFPPNKNRGLQTQHHNDIYLIIEHQEKMISKLFETLKYSDAPRTLPPEVGDKGFGIVQRGDTIKFTSKAMENETTAKLAADLVKAAQVTHAKRVMMRSVGLLSLPVLGFGTAVYLASDKELVRTIFGKPTERKEE
ncbi:hypothetical protein B0H67DRAFT_555660 [Lasiosphaeris hirsuta]|uniref:Uncharacterized protein n=1 Tax=Lasiosphaeris hirsuta TaxID=260670 RepID=A0AA40A9E8_9PEZI|nr:hypothetical protein B0H67DRAFT_555660 [Lasiosphaeris hirsuta]